MRTNYKIALAFIIAALLLTGTIIQHGPVEDTTEVHVGVSDD